MDGVPTATPVGSGVGLVEYNYSFNLKEVNQRLLKHTLASLRASVIAFSWAMVICEQRDESRTSRGPGFSRSALASSPFMLAGFPEDLFKAGEA